MTTVTKSGLVDVFCLRSGRVERSLSQQPIPLALAVLARSADTIAAVCHQGLLKVFDGATGKTVWRPPGGASKPLALAWSADGTRLATTSRGPARVWDLTSGQSIGSFHEPRSNSLLGAHYHCASAVAIAPRGNALVTLAGGQAWVWDIDRGVLMQTLRGEPGLIRTVAFSHDGSYVAAGNAACGVGIWNLSSEDVVCRLPAASPVEAIAFSPDQSRVALGCFDGTTRLWNLATGRVVTSASVHEAGVTCVAWSANGKYLATGSRDGTARFVRV